MHLVSRRPFEAVFITVWCVYFFFIALWGFQSVYDKFWIAVGYQILFVGVVFAIYSVLPVQRAVPARSVSLFPVVTTGLVISGSAIIALFISKRMAGIDYSVGLCHARYQMGDLGPQGTVLSAFGNLFSYAFFVPLVAVLTRDVSRRLFWVVLLASFLALMALSIVTSSRSTLLLFIGFILAGICIRLLTGRTIPRIKFVDVVCCIGILAIIGAFVFAVFACRAEASQVSPIQYKESFQGYLGVQTDLENGGNGGAAAKLKGLLGITVLYFVHSAYTFDGILSHPESAYGQIIFQYPRELLARMELMTPSDDWFLAGRFSSLPGAVYHDYGLIGFLFGAVLFGILSWFATVAVLRFQASLLATGFSAAIFTIMFLSPIHPAEEFMAFPFICFLFVAIPALGNFLTLLTKGHVVLVYKILKLRPFGR